MDRKILFSEPKEAIANARRIFAAEANVEWIIAEGAATVGGVFYDGTRGTLVLHRSERGMWTEGRSLQECKDLILAG